MFYKKKKNGVVRQTGVFLSGPERGGLQGDLIAATFGIEGENVEQEGRFGLQSVHGEYRPAVVEIVADGARVAIDQFQAERLLQAAVERFLAVDAHRIGRLVLNGTVRRCRRFTYYQTRGLLPKKIEAVSYHGMFSRI